MKKKKKGKIPNKLGKNKPRIKKGNKNNSIRYANYMESKKTNFGLKEDENEDENLENMK